MEDKEETVYEYADDTWWDDNGCDCCEAVSVECYNAVGWFQNGSAPSLHQLYCDVLLHYEYKEGGEELGHGNEPEVYLYQLLTIQDFLDIFERNNIKVIEVK